MSKIPFTKYHGTGNDFIIIDHRQDIYIDDTDTTLISNMCSRRFGIGADGLMVINEGDDDVDFEMLYYNSDGNISSMCGNGGRSITRAFFDAGLRLSAGQKDVRFRFGKDIYEASVLESKDWISLKMQDLTDVRFDGNAFVLDTGSPHFVEFRDSLEGLDVAKEGAAIRNNDTYRAVGINVNFCMENDDELVVRTFERGVEAETFSCGTGVVASAISLVEKEGRLDGRYSIAIDTKGGKLRVRFEKKAGIYSEIYLEGPAVKVFHGEW